MERNQNGYPMTGSTRGGCTDERTSCLDGMPLAYAYVPIQTWRMMYDPEKALMRGTMFEELDKPMEVYGNEW